MCDWGGDGDKVWSDGESSRAMGFSEAGIKVKEIGWGVKLGGNDTVWASRVSRGVTNVEVTSSGIETCIDRTAASIWSDLSRYSGDWRSWGERVSGRGGGGGIGRKAGSTTWEIGEVSMAFTASSWLSCTNGAIASVDIGSWQSPEDLESLNKDLRACAGPVPSRCLYSKSKKDQKEEEATALLTRQDNAWDSSSVSLLGYSNCHTVSRVDATLSPAYSARSHSPCVIQFS